MGQLTHACYQLWVRNFETYKPDFGVTYQQLDPLKLWGDIIIYEVDFNFRGMSAHRDVADCRCR